MPKESRKQIIDVYRDPVKTNVPGGDSSKCSGCGSRTVCDDAPENLNEWLARIPEKYFDQAEVRVFDSSTEDQITETIKTLNVMLQEKREDIRFDRENFQTFIARKAPLIAVDGLLFFIAEIPSDSKLERALEIAAKLKENDE